MFNPEACDLKPQQNAMVTVSPMIAKPTKIRVKFRRQKKGETAAHLWGVGPRWAFGQESRWSWMVSSNEIEYCCAIL